MRNSSAVGRPVQAGPAEVRPCPRLAGRPEARSGMNTERKGIRPDPVEEADPRLAAFTEWLASLDRCDWKAGLLATRKLRSMGLSCVLLPNPSGDRRGA